MKVSAEKWQQFRLKLGEEVEKYQRFMAGQPGLAIEKILQ